MLSSEDDESDTSSVPRAVASGEALSRARAWIKCFAIVTFDVDIGQKVDVTVPDGAVRRPSSLQRASPSLTRALRAHWLRVQLEPDVESAVAFLALPETNGIAFDETTYCFRVRTCVFPRPPCRRAAAV